MVFFHKAIIASLTMVGPIAAQVMTLPELAVNITMLSQKCQATQVYATLINTTNGPLIASNQGPYPVVIAGIKDIDSFARDLTVETKRMPGGQPGDGSDAVDYAMKQFVDAHVLMCNFLIVRSRLFKSNTDIGQPVVDAFTAEQKGIEELFFAVEDAIASKLFGLTELLDTYDENVQECIATYQGLVATTA